MTPHSKREQPTNPEDTESALIHNNVPISGDLNERSGTPIPEAMEEHIDFVEPAGTEAALTDRNFLPSNQKLD